MTKADAFLKQGTSNNMQLNINTDKYLAQSNASMNAYKGQAQGSFDKYNGSMNNNLGLMKQNVQQQINALNQQLSNNKSKYEMMGQEQSNAINKNYKEQNDAIDKQTFEQYKMSNQMGVQRGVSSSAQQSAMDNHVGQLSAGLFNQNSTNRADSLNTLKSKIMQGMIDLDNQYSKDSSGILTNYNNQMISHNSQMAGKELEFSMSMADKIMQQEMENNKLVFQTEAQKEQYRANLAKQIFEMQFGNLQKEDDRTWQSGEAEKQRNWQSGESAKDRAFSASQRRSSGGSGGSSQKEDSMMKDAMMQYYMDAGYNPMQARDLASQALQRNALGNNSGKMPSITQFGGYSTASGSNSGKKQSVTQLSGYSTVDRPNNENWFQSLKRKVEDFDKKNKIKIEEDKKRMQEKKKKKKG